MLCVLFYINMDGTIIFQILVVFKPSCYHFVVFFWQALELYI